MADFKLTSPAFQPNRPIPAKHSCEGQDASPALKWDGAPSNTKSFALICDDPDAPGRTWVHWVMYGIPATTNELPENISKADTVAAVGGAKQGVNDFGKVGYGGPCPPPGRGVHHYHFKLYALKEAVDLPARATKQQLETAMRPFVVGQAELIGTYQR